MYLSLEERIRYEEELRRKVQKFGSCWKLVKRVDKRTGYGLHYLRGKTVRAHRLAYAVFKEDFEDHLDVLHSCDLPSCINPAHLWLGTAWDNTQDMIRKGRANWGANSYGDKNGMRKHPEKSFLYGKKFKRSKDGKIERIY
jgi:hypothetical protein